MVIVECHKDNALVKRLGFSKEVRHEYGRSRVLGKLNDIQKGIGIVDEDPQAGQSSKLKEYTPQKDTKISIKLLKKKKEAAKQIIQISP